MDGKQDVKIDKFDTNIHRLESEVAEFTRNFELLKLRVDRLPSLTELKENLKKVKDMNDELGPDVNDQNDRAKAF